MMWPRSRNTVVYLEAVVKFSKPQWFFISRSYSDSSSKGGKMAPLQERRMIDRYRLSAKGGDGGNGCFSFRRSRHDRRGRPDGGNGGRGGDVILECSPSAWDFKSLQHHINAKRGGHGAPKNMIGSRGADKVVLVPVGTVIHLVAGELPSSIEKKTSEPLDPWDIPGTLDFDPSKSSEQSLTDESLKMEKKDNSNVGTLKESSFPLNSPPGGKFQIKPDAHWFPKQHGYSEWEDSDSDSETKMSEAETDSEELPEETEEIQYNVAELTEPGQRITVAQGGEGGLGNIHSSKGSKIYRDDTDSSDEAISSPNIGLPGSEALLLLELKSLADVGLVGMPNAGKSTLLAALSRARPTVGHYAFTTLRPNLGSLNYNDLSIKVADIPGLIRGAHENRGLGHSFLRHIERTKVLAYVLDLSSGLDGRKGLPPWEQLSDLMMELEFYREGLSSRPALVVANKIDETGAEEVFEELRKRVSGVRIYPVCAVLEEGVSELKDGLKMLVSGKGDEETGLRLESIVLN